MVLRPTIPELASTPVVMRAGSTTIVAADPVEVVTAHRTDALRALDELTPGWWAGVLTYDLGRSVERVTCRLAADPELPDLVLARYDARLLITDTGTNLVGSPDARSRLERRVERAPRVADPTQLGSARSTLEKHEFEAGVRAIVALIESGECYQVNLTRQLAWDQGADPIALFHSLADRNPAPHAALVTLPVLPGAETVVVSSSPERFLAWRGRDVETRPIKGTAVDAAWLRASAKDRAENVMIVDLARNDLGRVCEYGTVHVPELCGVEAHPGLHHLVSTIRGRLREGVGPGGLVRATFPPASVTGAPKPRVLQAIEDLEPTRRGVYCGAIGWLDTERDEGDLAVAIRTFVVDSEGTRLGVGGGIVADSDPAAEWRETELKAAQLLVAAAGQRAYGESELAGAASVPKGGRRHPATERARPE
ncbi:MAG: anthranilate synthase component I family protein [Acidimicrobiia bacterium]